MRSFTTHLSRTYAPLPTKWSGLVHWSPHFSTVARWTGFTVVWPIIFTKYGTADSSLISSVFASNAFTPRVSLSFFPAMMSAAFSIVVISRYQEYGDAVAGSTARLKLYTKSSAVTGSPLDHFAFLRRWKIKVLLSVVSQLSATPGIVLPAASWFTKPSSKSRITFDSGTPSVLCGSIDATSVPLPRTSSCTSANLVPAGTLAAMVEKEVVATARLAPRRRACVILFLYMHKLQVFILHPWLLWRASRTKRLALRLLSAKTKLKKPKPSQRMRHTLAIIEVICHKFVAKTEYILSQLQ